MTEASAIWMFLSICAICFTWHKIATHKRDDAGKALKFLLNGEPFNGNLIITTSGKTSRFKVVDGDVA